MKISLAPRTVVFLVVAPLAACAADAGPAPDRTQSTESAQVIVEKPNYRRQALVDFTGDKVADYADHDVDNGNIWVHQNLKNGTFSTANWGTGTVATGRNWEELIGDFNGDGYADFADHNLTTGGFYIHLNYKNGTFAPFGVNWGSATTTVGTNYETLVGDFNGDGYADYADHNLTSGGFYIHVNYKNGTFAPWGVNWGSGTTATDKSYETLIADFNGDGYADFADHNLSTGWFYIHLNYKNGTFAPQGVNYGQGGQTQVGSDWETVTGDFTGDGLADFADHQKSTGKLLIHKNVGGGGFAPTIWGGATTGVGTDIGILGVVTLPPLVLVPQLVLGAVTTSPSYVQQGQSFGVGGTVCNIGQAPSDPFSYFISGAASGGGFGPSIPPGGCAGFGGSGVGAYPGGVIFVTVNWEGGALFGTTSIAVAPPSP